MAGVGKDFQFRTFNSTLKELGILYRRELVILSTEDKRGKINPLNIFHDIESVTGQEVSIDYLCPTLPHTGNALLN
jgi:hypothetical protein